jgi:hypothetical protein
MIGPQIFRASRSHVIGINIVEFAIRAEAQTGGDGHQAFLPESIEKLGIRAGQVADITEAALDTVVHQRLGGEALRIRRGNSHSGLTSRRDCRRQLFIQKSGKNHYRNVARFAICNPQSGDKFALNSQALQRRSKDAAATVDHKYFVTAAGQ